MSAWLRRQLPDRSDFNATLACRRDLCGDLDRLVQVPRVDQIKARQLFLRLGERAVADRDPAVANADVRRCLHRFERFRGDQASALSEPLAPVLTLAVVHEPALAVLEIAKP